MKTDFVSRRINQLPLTFSQERKAISIIKKLLENSDPDDIGTVQALIDDYQNLAHYRCRTEGLVATEKCEYLENPDFFLISFK